jgi:thiol-disulfide isomerase/thioredoxin
MVVERVAALFAFVLALAGGVILWRLYVARQVRRLGQSGVSQHLAGLAAPGQPAVLYFTTPACAQCRFQQAPALAQLQTNRQDVQIVKLDAIEQKHLADYYQVMTAPTTVVLDRRHRPVAINYGLATADRLLAQIRQADGATS